MTLKKQIQEAQQALEDLVSDEVELFTLETALTAELEGLKATGSRDFDQLASLEGKRAAARSLLTEQRQQVASARQRLLSLQSQQERQQQLEALRPGLEGLRRYQEDTAQQLADLQAVITERLGTLQATRSAWAAERERVASEAGRLFGLPDPARLEPGQTVDQMQLRSSWQAAAAELAPDALATLQALPYSSDNPGKVHFRSGTAYPGAALSPHEAQAARQAKLGSLLDDPTRQAVYLGIQEGLKDQPHAFTVLKW